MKITEIQAELEAFKKEYGDLECLVSFKNQKGDWISDRSILKIYCDPVAVSPECVSVTRKAIVFKINGCW